MSEEMRTDLRQAEATVFVEGVLSEKNLEVKTAPDGKKSIQGNVVIKTDDTNFVNMRIWINELTAKNEPNNAYTSMLTVMNEYHSIAEVGAETATRVRCRRGNLQPNSYVGKEDLMIHTGINYSCTYLSRVPDNQYNPKTEFCVEGFINTIIEEIGRDEEATGRLRIGLFVPTYRGVEPLEIIVTAEQADDFNDLYERGQTAKFYGTIENRTKVEEKVVKLALGGSRTEYSRKSINELLLTGAVDPYDEENEFSAAAIQQGLVERDQRLAAEKEKHQEAKKKPAATTSTATSRSFPTFTGFAGM